MSPATASTATARSRARPRRPTTPSPGLPVAPATRSPSTPSTRPATAPPRRRSRPARSPARTRLPPRPRPGSRPAASARPRSRSAGPPRPTTSAVAGYGVYSNGTLKGSAHGDQLHPHRACLRHQLHGRRRRLRRRRQPLRQGDDHDEHRGLRRHDQALDPDRARGERPGPDDPRAELERLERQRRGGGVPRVPGRCAGRHGHRHELHVHRSCLLVDAGLGGLHPRRRGLRRGRKRVVGRERQPADPAVRSGRHDASVDADGSCDEQRRADLDHALVERVERQHRCRGLPGEPQRHPGGHARHDQLRLHAGSPAGRATRSPSLRSTSRATYPRRRRRPGRPRRAQGAIRRRRRRRPVLRRATSARPRSRSHGARRATTSASPATG